MIPLAQIPGGMHDPAAVVEHRLAEFNTTADAIRRRMQDYGGMEDATNWAHVGSVSHCLELLEEIAAFLNIPGFPHR